MKIFEVKNPLFWLPRFSDFCQLITRPGTNFLLNTIFYFQGQITPLKLEGKQHTRETIHNTILQCSSGQSPRRLNDLHFQSTHTSNPTSQKPCHTFSILLKTVRKRKKTSYKPPNKISVLSFAGGQPHHPHAPPPPPRRRPSLPQPSNCCLFHSQ